MTTFGLPRIAILGAGRAGSALFHNLSECGHAPLSLWTRSTSTADSARAEGFPATSGALPSLVDAELIFLAVSDPAVTGLAEEIAATRSLAPGAIVAHLAGALDLGAMAPLSRLGIAIGSFHPLVSIATRRHSFEGTAIAVDASSPNAEAALAAAVTTVGGRVIRPRGDRARYHAAAAVAGNFPQILLEAAIRLLLGCGLTRDEARAALGPLLVSAARNAAELGPAAGLTGPVARGDVEIVRKHLAAITDAQPVEDLYRASTALAIELAASRGVDVTALRMLLESDAARRP